MLSAKTLLFLVQKTFKLFSYAVICTATNGTAAANQFLVTASSTLFNLINASFW